MQRCCAILLFLATQHPPHLGQLLFQCKGPLTSLASRSSGSSLTAPQCVQQTLPTFSCSTYSACGSSAASACGTLLACRHLFKPCSGCFPPRRHGPWVDCIIRNQGRLTVATQEFLLSITMPLAVMLALLAYEMLVGIVKKAVVREQLHKVTSTSIIVLSTFLPQLLRAVFGLFACVPLDESVSAPYKANAIGTFWVSQMSQQCWQGYHKALALGAGVPLVLLLCVVWPGSILVFMLRQRDGSLYSSELRHYSFLFSMYKPSAAWWEIVVIVQLSVLVAVSVFAVRLGAYFGCLMLVAAFCVVLWLLVRVGPYKCNVTGTVATWGAMCVIITTFSTLPFLPAGTISGQGSAYEQYAVAVGVVVLCINLAFVVSVVWQVTRVVRWKALGGKINAMFGKLVSVCKRAAPAAGLPAALFKDADMA